MNQRVLLQQWCLSVPQQQQQQDMEHVVLIKYFSTAHFKNNVPELYIKNRI